ncbi:MAG: prephenate dehydratase [Candidatus Omnitrophica bacterium]|nr:prephenate dehydratase [Candidatus Omnitrophota bacterium]MBU4478370.1 prephenate dehydratase [Candidatus Omnitrophota bacterium]
MNIQKLRKAIDALDEKIIEILNKRTELAIKIGKEKERLKETVYMPARERQIYDNVKRYNKGPLHHEMLMAIYREVMSSTIVLQKPMKVAYLGPSATFTHLAGLQKFGSQVEYVATQTITDVFNEVARGNCDFGVVPVENSIEGAVNHTLDMLVDSDLKICSEILLDVSHNLLANCPVKEIKKVYSKSEVFGQCRLWLESNLPNRELIEVSSTSKAAEIAVREKGAAALASSLAARIYKLKLIAESIEDSPHNVTRFLVIGKKQAQRTSRDKTSLVFSVKDRVGALHDILLPFKSAKINLTKIESRPSKKKAWDYYFFVDMEGHASEPRLQKTIAQLEKRCHFLKILGSYPQTI